MLHNIMTILPSAAIVFSMSFASAVADWTIDASDSQEDQVLQDIVISLKLNPRSNAKAACLAVTLARSLRGDFPDPSTDARPETGANVTLFPTLDGVALGDAHVVWNPRFECMTPEGMISLEGNLQLFLCDAGTADDCDIPDDLNMNNMVICPLCWIDRYGYVDESTPVMPDYGVLNGNAVGKVLLGAEKVFDF